MPRIKRIGYSPIFNSLHAEAGAINENNDCAVKAVALTCNVPYSVAHETLAKLGRKKRKATWNPLIKDAIRQLGFNLRVWSFDECWALIKSYPGVHGRVLTSITTHHPRRFPKQWAQFKDRRLLFLVRGHIGAVIGGELIDWSVNKAKRVTEVWEVF